MTWSIERACVYAYSSAAVAVQGVLGACGRLEQVTRPPRRPFADYDEPLAEREVSAEEWRDLLNGPTPCGVCGQTGLHICPTEPGLTGDELVAVRQLIEPLTGPTPLSEALARVEVAEPLDEPEFNDAERAVLRGLMRVYGSLPVGFHAQHKTSASVKSTPGIGAEPNSPAASAAGDSPSEVCDIPPSPSEGRPTSELLTAAAQRLTDYFGGAQRPYEALVPPLIVDLRARAEVFRRVEDEGHDVGLSWAAETFPQFQKPQK